ncbi:hypothetical protein Tco_1271827 [Tanacetum coccineum]
MQNCCKDEFLDRSRFPKSQESRCGFEKCVGQKGDGVSSVCMDMIKECPCSSCIKAAYLWSDLLYQDTKVRIAGELGCDLWAYKCYYWFFADFLMEAEFLYLWKQRKVSTYGYHPIAIAISLIEPGGLFSEHAT